MSKIYKYFLFAIILMLFSIMKVEAGKVGTVKPYEANRCEYLLVAEKERVVLSVAPFIMYDEAKGIFQGYNSEGIGMNGIEISFRKELETSSSQYNYELYNFNKVDTAFRFQESALNNIINIGDKKIGTAGCPDLCYVYEGKFWLNPSMNDANKPCLTEGYINVKATIKNDYIYDGGGNWQNSDGEKESTIEIANCKSILNKSTERLIKRVMGYIQVLAPLTLIVMISVDLMKAVAAQHEKQMKESYTRSVKRTIAAICIYIIPIFVSILLGLPGIREVMEKSGIVSNPLCYGATGEDPLRVKSDINPKGVTKTAVNISLEVKSGNYSYATVNDERIGTSGGLAASLISYENKTSTINYTVVENGTYTFKFYNESDKVILSRTIEIKNIVKGLPILKCSIKEKTVYVNASAQAGIASYSYQINDGAYTVEKTNSFVSNQDIKKARVKVEDKVGNIAEEECSGGIMPQIIPDGKAIWKADSETLKIIAVSKGSYLATYIWAANPYEQLNSFTAKEFNYMSSSITTLMDKAVTKRNLQNKIVLATNSDVSVRYGSWNCTTKKWPKYTCMSIIIKDGKILYEDAENGYPGSLPFGITANGELKIYKFRRGTAPSRIETRRKLIEEVKNDGIRATHLGMNSLVKDGNKEDPNKAPVFKTGWLRGDHAQRTGICQLDRNNFITFTTKSSMSLNDLASEMIKLGCINGFNLDGGGSTTLKVKNAKENTLHRISNVGTSGGRGGMWGILYWTEL